MKNSNIISNIISLLKILNMVDEKKPIAKHGFKDEIESMGISKEVNL